MLMHSVQAIFRWPSWIQCFFSTVRFWKNCWFSSKHLDWCLFGLFRILVGRGKLCIKNRCILNSNLYFHCWNISLKNKHILKKMVLCIYFITKQKPVNHFVIFFRIFSFVFCLRNWIEIYKEIIMKHMVDSLKSTISIIFSIIETKEELTA